MCPPLSPDDDSQAPPPIELSADRCMLLDLRDTLYDGSWDDFVYDLEARLHGQPHVFDVVPDAAGFGETIRNHLRIISELRAWERAHHTTLHAPRPE